MTFAVKFGKGVPPSEAENMNFISSNTRVPMRKVFAAFTEPETKTTYIVIESVPGATLQALLPTLTTKEKSEISCQVRDAINELRKPPPPDYLGGIGRKLYSDTVFWTSDNQSSNIRPPCQST
jgi:hypothetical protein